MLKPQLLYYIKIVWLCNEFGSDKSMLEVIIAHYNDIVLVKRTFRSFEKLGEVSVFYHHHYLMKKRFHYSICWIPFLANSDKKLFPCFGKAINLHCSKVVGPL